MDALLKSFISLFFAIDAIGALPIVMGLSRSVMPGERRRLMVKASAAALAVGLIFLFGGKKIFEFLGILENDFRIAGGLLLILFSIRDLMVPASHQGVDKPVRVGIVPIAMPIMVGPAALATVLLSGEQYGYGITVLSFSLNVLFALVIFSKGDWILRRLGDDVSDAFAKIASLLLAAIGVMLMRSGIQGLL